MGFKSGLIQRTADDCLAIQLFIIYVIKRYTRLDIIITGQQYFCVNYVCLRIRYCKTVIIIRNIILFHGRRVVVKT